MKIEKVIVGISLSGRDPGSMLSVERDVLTNRPPRSRMEGMHRNHRIEFTAVPQSGESIQSIHDKLQLMAELLLDPSKVRWAEKVLANQDDFTGAEVKLASAYMNAKAEATQVML